MTDCNKCKTKARYCGSNLECLDIKKGESYDSIIEKINDLLCNELGSNTYTFEDNEDCTNGGIKIFENSEGEPTLLYETCFPCCDNELEQYLIDAKGDIQLFATEPYPWVNILGASYINEPTYEIQSSGKYKIILEEQVGGEENSKYIIGIGVNGNTPVFAPYTELNSNVTVTVNVGIFFYKKAHVYVTNLQEGDEISIWMKVLVGGVSLDSDLRLTLEKM